LISERDIRRVGREGVAEVDVRDAAVSPSAIDLAHRLGIVLKGLKGEDRRLRKSGKPSTARSEVRGQRPEGERTPAPEQAGVPPLAGLRIAVGADHGGVAMKDAIGSALREKGHLVVDHGTHGSDAVDYPDFALKVARAVASGAAELGIMVDGAGIGSCMTANKVPGVRAAMCYDVTTATNAREHNNANLLTLGGSLIGTRLALEIVERFLTTPFAGGRHERRVEKIDALDD
jgi:ribose 5-phosphate isomerase B